MAVCQVFEKSKENNLKEWLKIMTIFFAMRLTKIKEKKEGQLIGYIKKFFESVEKEKEPEKEEENLILHFVEFVLELLKFNPKYDNYLQQIRIKKNYEVKFTNQINKVISNFQTKKEVSFSRKRGLTKIELIDIVCNSL
jgi:hypothetical protein